MLFVTALVRCRSGVACWWSKWWNEWNESAVI